MSYEQNIKFTPEPAEENIFGVQLTPEEMSRELEKYHQWYEKENRKLERMAVPLNEKQQKVVGFIDEEFKKLFKRFNIENFDSGQIKIYPLKFQDFINFMKEDEAGAKFMLGGYDVLRKCVAINQTKDFVSDKSLIVWTENLAHELIHGKSYQVMQISKDNPSSKRSVKSIDIYRFGPQIYELGASTDYFGWLNEALATKLSVEMTEAIVNENKDLYIQSMSPKEKNKDHYQLPEKFVFYKPFRSVLAKMVEGIARKNKLSKEEVFQKLYHSFFTGRLLEVARLIEHTYGVGSFRALGNVKEENHQMALKYLESKDPQSQDKYAHKIMPDETEGRGRSAKQIPSREYQEYKKYQKLMAEIKEIREMK